MHCAAHRGAASARSGPSEEREGFEKSAKREVELRLRSPLDISAVKCGRLGSLSPGRAVICGGGRRASDTVAQCQCRGDAPKLRPADESLSFSVQRARLPCAPPQNLLDAKANVRVHCHGTLAVYRRVWCNSGAYVPVCSRRAGRQAGRQGYMPWSTREKGKKKKQNPARLRSRKGPASSSLSRLFCSDMVVGRRRRAWSWGRVGRSLHSFLESLLPPILKHITPTLSRQVVISCSPFTPPLFLLLCLVVS